MAKDTMTKAKAASRPSSEQERMERAARVTLVRMLYSLHLRERGLLDAREWVSQRRWAEDVAEVEGIEEPHSPSKASRWESGQTSPGADTCWAMCELANRTAKKRIVDPGWLYYGPKFCAAPEPTVPQISLADLAMQGTVGRPRGR